MIFLAAESRPALRSPSCLTDSLTSLSKCYLKTRELRTRSDRSSNARVTESPARVKHSVDRGSEPSGIPSVAAPGVPPACTTSTGLTGSDVTDDDGSSSMGAFDGDTIAAVAVTVVFHDGVYTEMDPSIPAREDDEKAPSGTERGGIRLLSEDDNSEIVSCGPGAEEPIGEPATVDMFTPRVGAIATESKEQGGTHQGRSRTKVMWGQGIRHPLAASTQQALDSSPTINVTHAMVIRKRDPESGPAALPDMTSRLIIAVEMGSIRQVL